MEYTVITNTILIKLWGLWGKCNKPDPYSGVQGYEGPDRNPTLTPRYPYPQPLKGMKTPAIPYIWVDNPK